MTPTILINKTQAFDTEAEQYEEIGTRAADSYFSVSAEIAVAIPLREATDEELLVLIAKSGAFSFWNSAEEDIYTLEDGSPI